MKSWFFAVGFVQPMYCFMCTPYKYMSIPAIVYTFNYKP